MDFISILSIFVLACFVGYYVVWSVTPALHTPLMAVTNAISSVIIVGALIASAEAGSASEASNLTLARLESTSITTPRYHEPSNSPPTPPARSGASTRAPWWKPRFVAAARHFSL